MIDFAVKWFGRIGAIWALKELPPIEKTILQYINNIKRGLFFIILGCLLFGITFLAGIYVVYDQLLDAGYNKTYIQLILLFSLVLLTIISFILGNKSITDKFAEKNNSKNDIDEKLEHIKDIAIGSLNGFLDGLCQGSREPHDKK